MQLRYQQISSKKVANRKHDQRGINYLEITKHENRCFRSQFPRTQHQFNKSNNLIIKQHRVIFQSTIETSNSSIERGTFSQVRKAHLIMQYHRVIVKDTIETITNSVTYHQVESENTTASTQVTKIEISTETYQNNIDYGTRELINSWWNSGKEKSENTAESSSVRFGRNSKW